MQRVQSARAQRGDMPAGECVTDLKGGYREIDYLPRTTRAVSLNLFVDLICLGCGDSAMKEILRDRVSKLQTVKGSEPNQRASSDPTERVWRVLVT